MVDVTRIFASVLALSLAGCASVLVTEPVGDAPVPIDTGDWQGTWISGEIILMTTVLDAEAGVMQAAWLEREEDGAKMEVFRGEVRKTGDWVFVSMPAPEREVEDPGATGEQAGDDNVPAFLWARLQNDGRTLLLWWPRAEAFRAAVRDGRLPGVVEQNEDVRLGELTAEHLALINDPGSGLLGWEEPLVFVRIGVQERGATAK